jgi:hypothetical protein
MKTTEFLTKLPDYYLNWGTEAVVPESRLFELLLKRVRGMTTQNILQLLNLATSYLEKDEIYLEVGTYQGAMICGALMGHIDKPWNCTKFPEPPKLKGVAVDNFKEFNHGNNEAIFLENIKREGLEKNVYLVNHDFRSFFNQKMFGFSHKIGIYIYDGAHDYNSQIEGLELVLPYLSNNALIVVDDTNEFDCQLANQHFLAQYKNCKKVLDLPTNGNGSPSWWNGIQVFTWSIENE